MATKPIVGSRPERIARRFHEVYEDLALIYGWETQERSRVDWDALPSHQRRLMVKTVTRLIDEGAFDDPTAKDGHAD